MHPFDLFVQRWQERGGQPTIRGNQARGLCPFHRDTKPSLSVQRRERDILFNCFFCGRAGKFEILRALDLTKRDLFTGPLVRPIQSPIIAEYTYEDVDGNVVAQKVRTGSKSFWFRRPDPRAENGWRDGLGGVAVGLYRILGCVGAPVVYVVEGEKAADQLCAAGLPTTCGPFGATRWTKQWSMNLWSVGCRTLVVFADNDQKGRQHADLVARVTSQLDVDDKIVVKVVQFPDVSEKADVVD